MKRIDRAIELAKDQNQRLENFKKMHEGYLDIGREFFKQPYEVDTSALIIYHLIKHAEGDTETN